MFPTFSGTGGSVFDPTLATIASGLVPQNAGNGIITGTGVDFNAGTKKCWATLHNGSIDGITPTINGKIQESTDNISFTDVAGGGFTQVTSANHIQTIAFLRTKRYLRANVTVAGVTMGAQLSVEIAEANQ